MPLEPGQAEIRGLVLGEGTPYTLHDFNPHNITVRSVEQERAWSHGAVAGAQFANQRVIPIDIITVGTDHPSWRALHRPLAAAFRPVGVEPHVEFRWMDVDGEEFVVSGYPSGQSVTPRNTSVGLALTNLGFVALDPLLYSAEVFTAGPLTSPTITGGLTFPATFPIVFTGVVSGADETLTNSGTESTGLVLTITGQLADALIQLQQLDGLGEVVASQELRVLGEVPAGSTLVIDTRARTAIQDNITSRRGDVTGDFLLLPPGESRMRMRATGSGRIDVEWRAAWW